MEGRAIPHKIHEPHAVSAAGFRPIWFFPNLVRTGLKNKRVPAVPEQPEKIYAFGQGIPRDVHPFPITLREKEGLSRTRWQLIRLRLRHVAEYDVSAVFSWKNLHIKHRRSEEWNLSIGIELKETVFDIKALLRWLIGSKVRQEYGTLGSRNVGYRFRRKFHYRTLQYAGIGCMVWV